MPSERRECPNGMVHDADDPLGLGFEVATFALG